MTNSEGPARDDEKPEHDPFKLPVLRLASTADDTPPPSTEVVTYSRGPIVPASDHADHPGVGRFWTPPGLVEACAGALRHLRRDGHSGTIGVTSAVRGEGRTSIAAGMAVADSYVHGQRVVLVEMDFEKPSFSDRYGVDAAPGVAEIVRDGATIHECIQDPNNGVLGVLTAGDVAGRPGDLLERVRKSTLLRDLAMLDATVIVDLPPLAPVGQAASLAALLGSVVLVVRSGAVPAPQIRKAIDALEEPPSVFLNAAGSSLPWPFRALVDE
jgi:Mrp family chromosome partitioning ATPase